MIGKSSRPRSTSIIRELDMDMLAIRHGLQDGLRKLGADVHGGGTDLITGEMDVTFDQDGRNYELRLIDKGAVEAKATS